MKLLRFKNLGNYNFLFQFENGEEKKSNIQKLIAKKISIEELKTARIDPDWKCLEFNEGMFDIEPKTLYNFCKKRRS